MSYITKMTANSYAGQFKSPNGETITVEGNFNTDSNKKINQFSGNAKQGDIRICDFSCNTYNNPVSFNYSQVSDVNLFLEALPAIQTAYESVIEELEEVN